MTSDSEPSARPEPSGVSAEEACDVVDDINRHLDSAGEFDRAALIPGMYLAWCVRLGLLDRRFAEQQAQAILRLHYNDGSCIEMLVTACGGTLKYAHLNDRGVAFTRDYYPQFLKDWRAVFGEDIYGVKDSWENYGKIAAVLTKALHGKGSDAKHRRRKTWRFWTW